MTSVWRVSNAARIDCFCSVGGGRALSWCSFAFSQSSSVQTYRYKTDIALTPTVNLVTSNGEHGRYINAVGLPGSKDLWLTALDVILTNESEYLGKSRSDMFPEAEGAVSLMTSINAARFGPWSCEEGGVLVFGFDQPTSSIAVGGFNPDEPVRVYVLGERILSVGARLSLYSHFKSSPSSGR